MLRKKARRAARPGYERWDKVGGNIDNLVPIVDGRTEPCRTAMVSGLISPALRSELGRGVGGDGGRGGMVTVTRSALSLSLSLSVCFSLRMDASGFR